MKARRLDEVRDCLEEWGVVSKLSEEAHAQQRRWDQGWAALAARAPSGAPHPRVFIEEWHRPPTAAGNWVPDMVRLAGGEPFLVPPGGLSLEVSWEEMMEFDPQLVVLSIRGLGLAYGPERWMELEGWNRVEAAAYGRVFSVDDSLFNRPSLGLLEGAGLLQGLIGEAFWGWPRVEDARVARLPGR